MIRGAALSLQGRVLDCQSEQQMEARLELQYQFTSQYPAKDQQPSLKPISWLKKSVVLVMLAETHTKMKTRIGKLLSLNRYFINYNTNNTNRKTYDDGFYQQLFLYILTKLVILLAVVILIMNNNSGSGEGVINPSDTQIEYFPIEKELSVRDESLRNFSFDASNKNHKQQAITFLSSYTPLVQTFSLTVLRQSANLRVKNYKQSVYYGEFQNGKKQGLGIMVYNNVKKYEGQWQNDKKSGLGTQVFPNGCIYTGKYQQGKPNGEGTYKWPTGQFYKGHWKNGERHGSGRWQATDGSSYSGQWRFSKPEGFGVYVSANGGTYEGQFKDSLKHGEGVQKFANGDMYRGSYTNGKPSGIGAYYWINGSYFKGSFLNGLREGKGFWKRGVGNSDKYQGSYKNDRKWGYGEFTWQSGNTYKGEYQADSRNGYGQMYWTNGACYKGYWLDGVQHGPGQIHVPGVGYRKGKFDNNVLVQLESQSIIQNSFREAHKNERTAKKTTTHSSLYDNQTNSNNSFRSKKREMVRIKQNSKRAKIQAHFEQNPNFFKQAKQEQKLISDGNKKRVESLNRYREEKKSTLPEQALNYSKQAEAIRFNNNQNYAKSFTRSQNRKYVTLDSKKEKPHIEEKMFKQSNIFNKIKWQNDKNEQPQKNRPQNRPHSKERLLHSSFYLYKLRQRNLPDTANITQINQLHVATPF